MFDESFVAEFYELYQQRRPLYEMALGRICDSLRAITSDRERHTIAEQRRVRVEIGRIKDANRLLLKAQSTKYSSRIREPADIFRCITDVVGTRVTCNTYEDVRRVEAAILETEYIQLYSGVSPEKAHEDYLVTPKESGYRALHLLLQVEVPAGARMEVIPAEVQLRTLLQHAWGELTHEDTFKPEVAVPPLVSTLSKRLATALAVLDEIAQDLRDEINKIEKEPAEAQDDTPRRSPLRSRDVEDTFADVFGRVLTVPTASLKRVMRGLERAGLQHQSDLQKLLDLAKVEVESSFRDNAVYLSDLEILEAIIGTQGDAKRVAESIRNVIRRRADGELRAVKFAELYSPGSIHLATVIRTTPRYAIAQIANGAQALISARHLEAGTRRVDLQDHFKPGDSVRIQVVNVDSLRDRIEARPVDSALNI